MVMLSYKSHAMALVGTAGSSAPYYRDPRTTSSRSVDVACSNSDGMIRSDPVKKLLGRLEEGLYMILGALRNYSIAYEALGGMRDQIEIAARNVGNMEFEKTQVEGLGL